jgi:SAM-dependent methyltransferase
MENNDTLNEAYWNSRYAQNDTGWDMGYTSPPLQEYISQLTNKNLRILIPGCGNSYEAAFLAENGFTDITIIDIAPLLVQQLKEKFKNEPAVKIVLGDFFEHLGTYDLIIEQTFFCALHPSLRSAYVAKMQSLLANDGKLAGLLFSCQFEKEGPPFGGAAAEYEALFKNYFRLHTIAPCCNSHSKRAGNELFIIFIRC